MHFTSDYQTNLRFEWATVASVQEVLEVLHSLLTQEEFQRGGTTFKDMGK